MKTARTLRTAAAFSLLVLSSCNQIGGIREGTPRSATECSTVADCVPEVPECRTAKACNEGQCVFDDAIEGTSLVAQTAGDCVEVVCDGAGKTRLVSVATDAPDDGNVCTLDACAGTTPTHTMQTELPCYTGPAATKDKGICVEGTQHCDAQGNPLGGCEGEVLPAAETCISLLDEDCDGKVNEEGNGCVCAPGDIVPCYTGQAGTEGVGVCHGGMQSCDADGLGYGMCIGEQKLQPETCDAGEIDEDCDGNINEEGADCTCGDGYVSTGEECDDRNLDSTDACTELCEVAVCGDGFVQAGVETCDDSNAEDTDACPSTCAPAFCGDSFVQAGVEACDDGNADDTDACVAGCVQASCGDSFVQAGMETCDDGNADSTDSCTVFCQVAACGDGFVQTSVEACDDGGTSDGDPCSPTCKEQKVLRVSGGYFHTCALLSGGSVKCWGGNGAGQLGLGDTSYRGDGPNEMGDNLLAVDLGTSKTASAVVTGNFHTCALLNDGSVKCWGHNSAGQLGLGDNDYRGDGPNEMGNNLPAVNLGTGKTASAIVAGALHTCALLNDGTVKCWGHNLYGQLGLVDTNYRGDDPNEMGDNLPAVNLGTGTTASVVVAGKYHTCALLNDDSVKCWGNNDYGQLGLDDKDSRGDDSSEMGDNLPAVNVGAGKTASAIVAGGFHTCAILNDGSVKCWGYNSNGQLGLGDTIQRGDGPNDMSDNLPAVNLGTGKTASAMGAGYSYSCAILNDGSVKCWGLNADGQLGLGDTNNRGDKPNEMGDNLPNVKLFSAFW